MKTLLLTILLLGCSGQAFTGVTDEEGNDTPTIGGGAGEGTEAGGRSPSAGAAGALLAGSSSDSGGQAGHQAQAGTSGASAMAGGPSMGEGGTEGASRPAECLAFFQNLSCARVCTNSASDCQAVLSCFVDHNSNSLDNCSQFSTTGISLAQSAERACCND